MKLKPFVASRIRYSHVVRGLLAFAAKTIEDLGAEDYVTTRALVRAAQMIEETALLKGWTLTDARNAMDCAILEMI